MKNILISVALCLGLIACAGSGEHPINSVPPPNPPAPTKIIPAPKPVPMIPITTTVKGDRWQFEVPSAWLKANIEGENIVKAAFANEDPKILVVLTQEPFQGTLDDYANMAANSIIQQGGNLVSARELDIEEQHYYLLFATRKTSSTWIWITTKDNFSYTLTCGGPTYETFNQETCKAVADSLRIITPEAK